MCETDLFAFTTTTAASPECLICCEKLANNKNAMCFPEQAPTTYSEKYLAGNESVFGTAAGSLSAVFFIVKLL